MLDHLNEALAALRKASGLSREDVHAIQMVIAALDVTLRVKATDDRMPRDVN